MKLIKTLNNSESGIVSITVTIIIMLIVTLITIGFATISIREQRQALDSQLSTQAFYAAESGINQAINDKLTSVTDCQSSQIGSSTVVSYSCLLVDGTPKDTLDYSDISTANSTIIPINSSIALKSITISWEGAGGSKTYPTSGDFSVPAFLKLGDWNWGIGVLRANIIPANSLTRANLINNTQTLYLYPRNAGQDLTGIQSGLASGHCDTPSGKYQCTTTIPVNNGTSYILRLRSIYKNSKVQITATGVDNQPAQLSGAQAIVDSTGKANDVLRRIQVRVPLTDGSSGRYPEYVLESAEDICKRFLVYVGGGSNDCGY